MLRIVCANCGQDIKKDRCYVCGDAFVQNHYFDSVKENRFCSPECFCEAMNLAIVPHFDLVPDIGELWLGDEYEDEDVND